MARKLLKHRDKLIYEMYCELWQSGLREELIWPKIKEKFHLEENTIYRIVLHHIKTDGKDGDVGETEKNLVSV